MPRILGSLAATFSLLAATAAVASPAQAEDAYSYYFVLSADSSLNATISRPCGQYEIHGHDAGEGSPWYRDSNYVLCHFERNTDYFSEDGGGNIDLYSEAVKDPSGMTPEQFADSKTGGSIVKGMLTTTCPYDAENPSGEKSATILTSYKAWKIFVYQKRPDSPEPYLVEVGVYYRPSGYTAKWSGGSDPNWPCRLG